MAACIDAAAMSSPKRDLYLALFLIVVWKIYLVTLNVISYTWESLIYIEAKLQQVVSWAFQFAQRIPTEITRAPGSPWIIIPGGRCWRWQRERKKRRGCRARALARLKQNTYKPPLPSLFISNVRSLKNKMDELRLSLLSWSPIHKSCVMIITKTWLHPGVPDEVTELVGCLTHHSNRCKDSGKGVVSVRTITGAQTLPLLIDIAHRT